MTEHFGINIIESPNLPIQLYNKKLDKWEIFHMIQSGDTIYVSKELFKAIQSDLG